MIETMTLQQGACERSRGNRGLTIEASRAFKSILPYEREGEKKDEDNVEHTRADKIYTPCLGSHP